MPEPKPDRWMRWILAAAAAESFLFSAWAILMPDHGFQLAGLSAPLYPEIFQGVGLLIGACGVGYAVAATNPLRHWSVVLMGLTGKVAGVLGLAWAFWRGRLPAPAATAAILGDLVWWLPFGLILRGVYMEYVSRLRYCSREVLSIALRGRTNQGRTIDELSRISPVMLVFLRHAGCMFCREALADIARERRRIEASGTQIVLVHLGEEERGRDFFRSYGLGDVPQISDPKGAIYRAFGLPRGSLRMLFGPKVWWRGFEASILEGHRVGRLRGDPMQMPGVFLVFHGQILRSFRHQSAADRPDYVRFVSDDLEFELMR